LMSFGISPSSSTTLPVVSESEEPPSVEMPAISVCRPGFAFQAASSTTAMSKVCNA